MLCSCRTSSPFPLALSLLVLTPQVQADPAPRERSFRPMVPIKQDVRSGAASMRSQIMTVVIPSRPISEPTAVPAPAERSASAPETVVPAAADETPEPKRAPATEAGSSFDGDESALPGGSETPPAENGAKNESGPTLTQLREEAHALAGKKLSYVFGADDPDSGGLDCSATVQYLLSRIGIKDVPRTSYDQYNWLKRKKLLDDVYGKGANSKLLKKLSPGDLIFWGGTWKSGHRVSHVMLYMGYDPTMNKHYVFGARSKSVTGLTGAGVDIFELDTERGRLVAHGKIPGLVYE